MRTKRITLRVTESTRDLLSEMSIQQGRTMNNLINRLLENYLKGSEKDYLGSRQSLVDDRVPYGIS